VKLIKILIRIHIVIDTTMATTISRVLGSPFSHVITRRTSVRLGRTIMGRTVRPHHRPLPGFACRCTIRSGEYIATRNRTAEPRRTR
jgi:hypothetical protein